MDVIRQYQEVIGHPKMMPLWAHGLMTKSFAYKNTDLALQAIKKYKEMDMPLQSLILPLDYFNEHFTPDATVVTAIRQQYPKAQDLSLVLPFTPIVPNTNLDIAWIKDFDRRALASVDGNRSRIEVYVERDTDNEKPVQGWCMEVFNPMLRGFLSTQFVGNIQEYF